MWDRITLKTRGKAAFLKNYWTCVAVAFVLSLFLGGSGSSIKNTYEDKINSLYFGQCRPYVENGENR